ncbi:unnamed protein product, partial [Staurois parvus]
MMDNQPPLTSPDGSSYGNPPERCPRPLYSRDSTQEGHTIPHHHQSGNLRDPKIEIKTEEEEAYVRDDQQSMEEDGITGTFIEEDTPTEISTGENPAPSNVHPAPHSVDGPSYSSSPADPQTLRDQAGLPTGKSFSCTECGKCFNFKSNLDVHKRSHTGEKEYSCTECGKCFLKTSQLVSHQRSHTGEKPFSCSECGKCFSQRCPFFTDIRDCTQVKNRIPVLSAGNVLYKNHYLQHIRGLTRGKSHILVPSAENVFSRKSNLTVHQRSHMGEKLHSCSECGKCFLHKSDLVIHYRSHTGEELHYCSVCGKWFTRRSDLVRHQRSHTGEKPYS